MQLAIFDLDNTLLNGDSDFLWGQFLVDKKLVDEAYYKDNNDYYYNEYKAGRLNIDDFLKFSLKPLSTFSKSQLDSLHQEFMADCIIPLFTSKSLNLIQKHKTQNHYCLIITATNLFVTEPISQFLKMDDIIATVPEFINNQYTGKVDGIPSFQQGKVLRLKSWLAEHPEVNLDDSYFYSDSINDLPLLELVSYPIVVDPDIQLKVVAQERKWKIISLR